MKSNNVKTYEEEVFCPPTGDTFDNINRLNIYCCPINFSTKEAIYLMPRLPVNSNETYLKNTYGITALQIRGKGFVEAIYEIKDSFIVNKLALDAIEDVELRGNIKKWFEDSNLDVLKVFVLGHKMVFKNPKFTNLQNNAYKTYFTLASVWNN